MVALDDRPHSVTESQKTNDQKHTFSLNFFIHLFFLVLFTFFALRNKCLQMSYE